VGICPRGDIWFALCSSALAQVRFTVGVQGVPQTQMWRRQSCRSMLLLQPSPQVLVEGRAPQAWETAVTSDDVGVVVVDGCWLLPAPGQ
jgi:hypothetical protein